MILPVVGETFVEVGDVLFGDIFGFSHPDRLGLVKFLQFSGDFFYFLFLLVLLLILLNLDVFLLLFFVLVVRDLFFGSLLNLKVNWETDEFGVLLNQILQFSLLEQFHIVALDAEDNL